MKTAALSFSLVVLMQVSVLAQGVLVITNERIPLPRPRPLPRPQPVTYRLEALDVNARIHNQIADVQVSQTFVNSGRSTIQARFVFPLPYDGAIDAMTLLVNGKELPAKLLSAKDARARYEAIVRSQRDPALLEWIGTGMFQTSVFPIPPGETRTVSIHYNQLLRTEHGLTDFVFPLRTAKYTSKPIERVKIRVALESATKLKNIYSPSHPVQIKRPSPQRAIVTYETEETIPTTDFRLFSDARKGDVGVTLITYRPDKKQDGFFLLLASPDVKRADAKRLSKTVSFVVDKSGSMSGKKIEQAREALKFVLNNLREGDLFNIVSYDSQVQSFRPELEAFNEQTRAAALGYVDGLYAGGGTNIHDALSQALGDLQDDSRPNYVLFLTDGRPTSGQTNESLIAQAASSANQVRARILTFGVGYDVNSRLLDRISRENHGLSEYVRPDEDIEEHVARVFRRISSPVLTNAELVFELDDTDSRSPVNRLYPGGSFDLFEGEQLVVVGRYKHSGAARIRLSGHVGDETKTYEFTGEFDKKSRDDTNVFIEKLWATRRIGEIIDEIDLHGQNEELVEELVALSTKHGILTPYTAFLADETVRPELASSSNRELSLRRLSELDAAGGRMGFEQRGVKQMFKNANNQPDNAALNEFLVRSPAFGLGGVAGEPASVALQEAAPVEEVVRNTSTQTIYKRGKLLVTPETAGLDLKKDKEQIVTIERYSADYFELIAANTQSENELFSQQDADEELLVQLRGKNYLIK